MNVRRALSGLEKDLSSRRRSNPQPSGSRLDALTIKSEGCGFDPRLELRNCFLRIELGERSFIIQNITKLTVPKHCMPEINFRFVLKMTDVSVIKQVWNLTILPP